MPNTFLHVIMGNNDSPYRIHHENSIALRWNKAAKNYYQHVLNQPYLIQIIQSGTKSGFRTDRVMFTKLNGVTHGVPQSYLGAWEMIDGFHQFL